MKNLFAIILFFLPGLSAFPQAEFIPFGKPLKAELEMKSCAFDPGAAAMKLLDIEEKEVLYDYGFKIKSERRVKIKIFNEKGFDFANISIPYISRAKGTKVTDISAYIYYLDNYGNIITEKVEKKQIFRDKQDDKVKKVKFTFPNVKPGCVVEYRYEKTEKNSLHLDPWFFQDLIPTAYSRFSLTLPSAIDLDSKTPGADSVYKSSSYSKATSYYPSTITRTFLLKDVHAFRPEVMMSSVADNLKRVEFAIQPSSLGFAQFMLGNDTWKLYAHAMNQMASFGQQYRRPIPGTEQIIDSAKLLTGKEERINYIFQKVKQHIKWDDEQTFYPGDLAEAWREQTGSSAEINLTVLNLLRKAGISCSPVLISTRQNGKADAGFFSLSQFNGVDVLIMDSVNSYLLDGTRKYQSFLTPPDNIMNRQVLNIDTAGAGWLFITDTRPLLKTLLSVYAVIDEAGKVSGNAAISYHDHSKVYRIEERNKPKDEEIEEEKEFLRKDFTELKIDSMVVENENDETKPLTEKFVFSYEPSSSGDFIFLDPFFLSSFRKNPFTDSVRHTSIDFNSRQYLMTSVTINLPDNYEVSSLPKNIRMRMADSSVLFSRVITHKDNIIRFVNTMEVLYPVFEPDEYPGIADFFSRMYGMITEQIILKKKK